MIGLKKKNKEKERKTNVEKRETHIDNREFGFWVEISTNYYFILYMADKASLIFLEKKSKMQPISSSLGNNTFLFGMLYKTKTSEILTIFHVSTIFK